ncbi:hypothetical protein [Aestuariispira ectoiniformans]|uniref:hypothetical protein n=1 Tax=Aestuariispira ectoiniformans TaxID=2775080 RepID=UPI00223C3BCD|nr:hypothetical protein [Aestuariispira ectoiniformans]
MASDKVLEILQYVLKAGSGAEFHTIMDKISVPLHRQSGMDVVAYGQSQHNPDAYFLMRAFDDMDHLEHAQADFYASEAWRYGPRNEIVPRISTSVKTVIPLPASTIDTLRRNGGTPD